MASDNAPGRSMPWTMHEPEPGRSRWSGLVGVAGLIACGVAFFAIVQAVGPDRLREAVVTAGPLAPIAYVLLNAITVIVTPLSGTPLRLAAGTLFGFWRASR